MSAVAGYGTWRSPITAEAITAGQVGLADPRLDRGSAYWLEARPQEAGRTVLVRRTPAGERQDLTPHVAPTFAAVASNLARVRDDFVRRIGEETVRGTEFRINRQLEMARAGHLGCCLFAIEV